MTRRTSIPTDRRLVTALIDPDLTNKEAIVAALMAAAHESIARIADGATWEDDEEIRIRPDAKPHALSMARIWTRAAEHLQGSGEAVSVARPRRVVAEPARSDRAESDGAASGC